MDYKRRIAILRDKLRDFDIDCILITSKANYFYMSGFNGSSCYLLITQNSQYLFTDFRYIEQAKIQCKEYQVIKTASEPFAELIEVFLNENIKTVAFEADKLSYNKYIQIEQKLHDAQLRPIENIIENMRQIKEAREIEKMRHAAKIADIVFESVLEILKPGISENEVAAQIEFLSKKEGASDKSFDTIIASGKRASLPHGTATDKVIEQNDVVVMDYGVIYEGYCSDITRTVFIGSKNDELVRVYNIVLEAQMAAINSIKAEVSGVNVDETSRNIISNYGYGEYFGHSLGHGIGIEVHESATLSPKSDIILKQNMITTVEPGIYIPGLGGVRIEDMVLIKQDGVELLTNASKDLLVI